MQVWNMLHAGRWKYRKYSLAKPPKNRHLCAIAQICRAISSQIRHVSTIGKKNLLSSNISSRCPRIMVNLGLQAAEIDPVVWGTPANFDGFRVLAALLHGTPVVGVSQTLRRWTEGATYIRHGGHHVGHWPTFYFTHGSIFRPKRTPCCESKAQHGIATILCSTYLDKYTGVKWRFFKV